MTPRSAKSAARVRRAALDPGYLTLMLIVGKPVHEPGFRRVVACAGNRIRNADARREIRQRPLFGPSGSSQGGGFPIGVLNSLPVAQYTAISGAMCNH